MNFLNFIKESKDQLDISIQAAGKVLTTDAKRKEFLTSQAVVEHKTDGIKLTVIKRDNKGQLSDWIFGYKGEVLYSSEFDFQTDTKAKKESIGSSQFKLAFKHFDKLGKTSVPVGTELFIEFLMSKPTLSSNYNTKHKMVLIGYAPTKWEEKFGRLKSNPGPMQTNGRDKIAKELKIDVPQLLFKGIMGSQLSFEKGIIHKGLKSEFMQRKLSMNWDNPELLVDDIREMFLAIESKYGGKEEGVVVKYNDRLIKFQQAYQLDQAARASIKAKYNEDNPEDQAQYWKNVQFAAMEIVNGMTIKSRKLDDLMSELANEVKKYKVTFGHTKRTPAIIKEDIQTTAKLQVIKQMRGNNNALILGKFRVISKEGHYKLIKRAATLYDNVVVCIVTSKDTKETLALRTEMMEKVQKSFKNVEIIHHGSGNLVGILNKSPININVVYAGTDRVGAYREQLKTNLGMSVKEMTRTDNDISASKIIENISDKEFFEANTPSEIHSMYNKIKKAYE